MLKYTDMPTGRVLEELKTSAGGLNAAEAKFRLEKYGANVLSDGKKISAVGLFFSQFCDVMTLLLIAAACISAVVAYFSGEGSDLADTAIISAIIFLNAVVGTAQQYRADKAIERLKRLNGTTCKVRRGGEVLKISAEELTLGDVVLLEEGDVVPADLRIIKCASLKCGEAALTGESNPVEKTADTQKGKTSSYLGAKNLAFSSSYVVGGSGEGVVIATGSHTEIGKIAGELAGVKKVDSPLEKGLSRLGKIISIFVICVAAVIFLAGYFAGGQPLLKSFMTSVAIAVAAIPEGLPAVVSVIMALGVQKMSRRKVIVRKLKCVETLGSCSCICTDKTGTITKNEMKVVRTFTWNKSRLTKDSAGGFDKLIACMAVCTHVKGEKGAYIGDPTEVAVKAYADEKGNVPAFFTAGEIPFSSERKMMSVRAEIGGKSYVFCKGAAEKILHKCTRVLKEGEEALTPQIVTEVKARCAEMSAEALRVMAFAYKEGDALTEEGLTFLGVCGMSDEVRQGVKEAVSSCRGAGISTVMITGDSAETALAVARIAGIAQSEEEVITGEELDKMTKPQLKQAAARAKVFARVSPKHKNIIVKLKQAQGEVVAMTGDGVNDAPAVKSADIGIVMGKSGTDVAKSVADMVICDDDFSTIVTAVREGRRISDNVKKTIQFFLSTNLAEVFSIALVTLFFFGKAFMPSTQLLWLNLITDSFPVLALGVERGDDDFCNPPVAVQKAIFSKRSIAFILVSSLYITGVTVGAYAFFLPALGEGAAVTLAFLVITFAELFHVFNVRCGAHSFVCGIFSNRVLWATVAAGVAVNIALCLSPLASAFGIASLSLKYWAAAFALALSVIPFCEAYKLIGKAFFCRAKKKRAVNKKSKGGVTA